MILRLYFISKASKFKMYNLYYVVAINIVDELFKILMHVAISSLFIYNLYSLQIILIFNALNIHNHKIKPILYK